MKLCCPRNRHGERSENLIWRDESRRVGDSTTKELGDFAKFIQYRCTEEEWVGIIGRFCCLEKL